MTAICYINIALKIVGLVCVGTDELRTSLTPLWILIYRRI